MAGHTPDAAIGDVLCEECLDVYGGEQDGLFAIALVTGNPLWYLEGIDIAAPVGFAARPGSRLSSLRYLAVAFEDSDQLWDALSERMAEAWVDDLVSDDWLKQYIDLAKLARDMTPEDSILEEGDAYIGGEHFLVYDISDAVGL